MVTLFCLAGLTTFYGSGESGGSSGGASYGSLLTAVAVAEAIGGGGDAFWLILSAVAVGVTLQALPGSVCLAR